MYVCTLREERIKTKNSLTAVWNCPSLSEEAVVFGSNDDPDESEYIFHQISIKVHNTLLCTLYFVMYFEMSKKQKAHSRVCQTLYKDDEEPGTESTAEESEYKFSSYFDSDCSITTMPSCVTHEYRCYCMSNSSRFRKWKWDNDSKGSVDVFFVQICTTFIAFGVHLKWRLNITFASLFAFRRTSCCQESNLLPLWLVSVWKSLFSLLFNTKGVGFCSGNQEDLSAQCTLCTHNLHHLLTRHYSGYVFVLGNCLSFCLSPL